MYTNIAVDFGEQIENTETYEKYLDVYLSNRSEAKQSAWNSLWRKTKRKLYRLEIGVYGKCYTLKKEMNGNFTTTIHTILVVATG